MSVQDDALSSSGDSFWDVEGYKRTVKRQEEGQRLCNELMQLIQERADIEKHYAKQLKAWSKKWGDMIEKGPEYGTSEGGWRATLSEADGIADIRITIKDQLLNEVQPKIKQWKTDNYHKGTMGMGPAKETKQLEEEFRKAQKPWAKKFSKVKDARKAYWTACKTEKSYTNQENNARSDSAVSSDQMKKVQEKADKARKDVETTRQKYEHSLEELNMSNAKYMEDMTEVFAKSQNFESNRLQFFREMLFGVHNCLDVSQNVEIPAIYNQFHHTVDHADHSQDLKWWSQNHGVDQPMNWPTFEEFKEELHDISSRKKLGEVAGSNITLRRINTEKRKEEFPEYSAELHSITKKEKKGVHVSGSEGITLTSAKHSNPAPPPSYKDVTASNGPHSSTATSNSNSTSTPPSSAPQSATVPRQSQPAQTNFDADMNPFGYTNAIDLDDTPSQAAAVATKKDGCDSTHGSPESIDKVSHHSPARPPPPLHKQQSYDPNLNPFGEEEDEAYSTPDEGTLERKARDEDKIKTISSEESENVATPLPSGSPPPKPPRTPQRRKPAHSQNPFGDDEWDEFDNMDNVAGVSVRALYDYMGQEEDELTFKAGETFMKLKDRDDQGWCTGRKDGRVGLYPDNYVENA